MRQLGRKGISLAEVMTAIVILGILASIADTSMRGYLRTARLQSAVDMILTDIRQARFKVLTWGDPYRIDFEPKTSSYLVNGVSRIQLPPGISFGAAEGVSGRPSDPYTAPPASGITFRGDGTVNRAEFLPKGLVVPTGAVYLTNGKETLAITVTVNGHTTAWRSRGGSRWVEI